MYCTKCGTKIEDKYKYCPKCGQEKYKKEEPLEKRLCKILYYIFLIQVIISVVIYLVTMILSFIQGESTLNVIAILVEMVINNILPVIAIFVFKKISEGK